MVDCGDHVSRGVLDQFRVLHHQYTSGIVKHADQLVLIMQTTKMETDTFEESFLTHLSSLDKKHCCNWDGSPMPWKTAQKFLMSRGIKRGKPQLEAPGDGNTEAEAPVGGSPELEALGTGATEVGPPEHGVLEKKVDQLKKNQALPADFDFVPQRSEAVQNL